MNKAFIFDWDGVLIASERVWGEIEREAWPRLFGEDVAKRMPDLIGTGLKGVLDVAAALGATFEDKEIARAYETIARHVYARSELSPGTEALVENLVKNDLRLGIVTQSGRSWVADAVSRLPFRDKIEVVITLPEHLELKRKPAPDGFLEAFRVLNAEPKRSIILEDSNLGIEAAKASGAYVIGFRGNLVEGYEQTGADAYANTMEEVARIVEKHISS